MATIHNKKNKSSGNTNDGSPVSSSPPSPSASHGTQQSASNNAPKYGTLVPNRIFVGGISSNTTENELAQLFSAYGNVKATKVISDRAGVSKGYGFVTFETAEEATRLMQDSENITLKERKLNIAPAIKKQPFSRSYEVTTPPTVHGNTIFYQNGLPYTFHNGVAYFPSTPATHPAAPAPLTPGADPNTIFPTTFVPPTATAHTSPASYPIIYAPCAGQPLYLSQQFQYQPVPQPAQSSQYMYTAPPPPPSSGVTATGPNTVASPPNQTMQLATLSPTHYYSPNPMTAGEVYYNVTSLPPGQSYGPIITADNFLFETAQVTESSSNQSPEDSSSNSSCSDSGNPKSNCKTGQDSKGNTTVRPDKNHAGWSVNGHSSPSPLVQRHSSTPPVVSLLKLQQGSAEEKEGNFIYKSNLPSNPPSQYHPLPPPVSIPPHNNVVSVLYPVVSPGMGSIYMNHNHSQFPTTPFTNHLTPVYSEPFQTNNSSENNPHTQCSDKIQRSQSYVHHSEKSSPHVSSQFHFSPPIKFFNNGRMASDGEFSHQYTKYTKGSYQKRPFNNRNMGSSRFGNQSSRFSSPNGVKNNNGLYSCPQNSFSQSSPKRNSRQTTTTSHSVPPLSYSRSQPYSSFQSVSVSTQFQATPRPMFYQTVNNNTSQRRFGNARKSSSVNGSRSSNNGSATKYSAKMGLNGIDSLPTTKLLLDEGGAGDGPAVMSLAPPNGVQTSVETEGHIQETCHDLQALSI